MEHLTAKWEKLIEDETGASVKVSLPLDNQVRVIINNGYEDKYMDILCLFLNQKRKIDIGHMEDGFLFTFN